MIVVEADYLQGRSVFGQVVCSFRYGREEDEVMGLNFQKDLFLVSERIFPPKDDEKPEMTRLQVACAKRPLAHNF